MPTSRLSRKPFERRSNRTSRFVSNLLVESLESRLLLSSVMHPTFVLYRPIQNAIRPAVSASPSGVAPATMRTAYGVDVTKFGTIVGDGTGQTIAIVDAYSEPTITTDLAAFDTQYGLPAPPSFTVVNQTGGSTLPAADAKGGWGVETALDVEWAHVMAPKASILLVSATSSSDSDLYTAVDTARNWAGVSALSMSWGGDETSADSANDSHFTTPSGHIGVTFLSSSGDAGAYSDTGSGTKIVGYPAASPNVVGIGGTTLTTGTGGAWSSEAGWGNSTSSYANGGSGGGISKYAAQPTYQKGVVTQSTTYRTVPDVSLDADPNSGAPVYSSYDDGASTPWLQVGGTSLASPMWAGVIAVVNQGRVLSSLTTLDGPTQTLPKLYALPAADFHDITTGNNGYAAGTGYDLVTGRGSPIVNLLAKDLIGTTSTGTPAIGSFAVSPTSVTVGSAATLTASNVTDTGSTISAVNFYRESNGTSGLQTSGDTLIGTGTQNGTTWTISTSTTGLTAGTYTYYAVASDASGSVTAASATTLTVTSATSTPIIGSFAVSPASVTVGSSATLTASNVTDTGSTISAVNFYRESNGTAGLQTSGDTLIGTGTQSGTTWTISATTTGLTAGSYTYYAVASDAAGASTAASSTTLTVTTASGGTPTIGSFTDGSSTIVSGGYVSLYAKNVTDTGAAIAGVRFYRESNGTSGLQTASDTYLGMGVKSGSMWTFDSSTTGLSNGTYTYYAVASDTANISSAASSVTATISGSGFSNWSSFSAALAKIPLSVGAIASTSVINFGTTVYTGALDTTITLDRIRGDNGPNRSGDGGAFTNNGSPPLPTNRGSFYEFTINPQTGSSPSFTSSQVAFPGPMRFMIDTTGDIYFTGDHYATDMSLYIAGTPSLGSLAVSPTTVSAGSPISLTSSNVTETISPTPNLNATTGSNVLATVTNVQFYLETNGTSGLQTGTDLLLGSGTQNGSTWTLSNVSTSGLAAGSYTLYTVAIDPAGNTTAPATTTLTISGSAGTPTIGSFAVSPTSVTVGTSATLTASNVTDTGSTISAVKFYRESNGTTGLQIGSDTLIGTGTQSGTTWTISISTTGLTAGSYTYYAVATDASGTSTAASSSTLTVNSATPIIGSFSVSPTSVTAGTSATLTASNVTESGGTITAVNFYRESNSTTGLQIGSDTLLGTGTQNGTTWTISAPTTGLSAGTYTYYAVATDSTGTSTAASSTILAVTSAPTPLIGSFSVSPTSVTIGTYATLTASNVTDTGSTITAVKFYRESNGTSGLQMGSDTLVGTGTQAGTTWTISTSTTGLAAGSYTYYAVATDALGTSTSPSSTSLTVTALTPIIGSFTVSPTAVAIGTSATLTASNVTESGGTISNVKFYRESNGTTGLQTSSDTLIGTGTASGTTWTISTSTTGLTVGTYTYYALATDSAGNTSAPSSTALTVNAATIQPDRFEPDDTLATSHNFGTLTSSNAWTGLTIHSATDVDWYKFTTTAIGTTANLVRIDFTNSQGDLDMSLYNSAGSLLKTSAGVTNSEIISLSTRTAAVYYVKVYGYIGATNPNYTLTINAPGITSAILPGVLSSTNTPASDTNLGLLTNAGSSSTVSNATGNDFYTFTTTATSAATDTITFSSGNSAGNLQLELYDNAGTRISQSAAGTVGSISLSGLAAGTYTVRVSAVNGVTSPNYILTFDTTQQNVAASAANFTVLTCTGTGLGSSILSTPN